MTIDTKFAGSIPALYEKYLVPTLFAPYADDVVERAAALAPRRILEIAAGTGVVSRRLACVLCDAQVTATDLNEAMLEVAQAHDRPPNLSFKPADAQALPFADGWFDLVVAQFGAMFFPDKTAAYREALRVLAQDGTFIFNVWDRLELNPGSAAIHQAVRDTVPEPKPDFIARTPFGYCDTEVIERELHAAGFGNVLIEQIERFSPPNSAALLARGMCLGSPLANELAIQSPEVRERALSAAIAASEQAEGDGRLAMSALVVTATR